ncbi:uncharacterized protein ACWYII_030647 [Salvelinus alpinus]
MVWPLRTPKTNWMRLLKRQNALLRSSTKRRTHKPNWTRPLTRQKGWENKKKKTNKPPGIRFRWRQRDERGQIVPQTRKATTSTSLDCFLPLDVPEVICGCLTSTIHVGPGKHIILVGINGRYNVTVPVLTCTTCFSSWTANLADLIKNGYWPATVNCDTIYQVDLFSSFEELKVSDPGMSCLVFMLILEQRTDFFGRNEMICGDTFQKSFFGWTYCRSEIDQVCDIH